MFTVIFKYKNEKKYGKILRESGVFSFAFFCRTFLLKKYSFCVFWLFKRNMIDGMKIDLYIAFLICIVAKFIIDKL